MKPKQPKVLERDITRSIRDFLKVAGVCHYKQWQGLGSEKGIPDIICIEKGTGRYCGVEVKTATGKMSEHQLKWKQRIEAAGGRYILARSVDDVVNALRVKQIGGKP